jgi:hypothetical protein
MFMAVRLLKELIFVDSGILEIPGVACIEEGDSTGLNLLFE